MRRILRIPYTAHQSNESVWKEITNEIGTQEHLLATIKRRKLRWFGHVNRSTGVAKLIMQGLVEGGRGRGRPRMAWPENIKSWTARTSKEINRLSQESFLMTKIPYDHNYYNTSIFYNSNRVEEL